MLATVVVVATVATGVLIWRLTRNPAPEHPEISAYSHGQLVRVGPYLYCDVLNLTECQVPQIHGGTGRNIAQPGAAVGTGVHLEGTLAAAAGLRGSRRHLVEAFASKSTRAVTIPTVDPRRGRLTGIVVQLPTWVRDEQGNEFPVPHAEWSISTAWS